MGDFNGDGKADLAVADFTGIPTNIPPGWTLTSEGNRVSVLLGNGNGTFPNQDRLHRRQ